jgi:HAE1 family hydrophobic/amphiphilic exporter-1
LTAREYRREGGISRFSLDRRITVLVLFLTLLVVGAVATARIPVELIPSGFSHPFLAVIVPWEGAPPTEVAEKVSLPLEEELSTVRGIDDLISIANVGRARAYMMFKQGTDMDIAYREVRDRVERARNRFPDDIDRVYIRKEDASGIPSFVLGIAIDPTVSDTYDLIQNEIILPLSRIDGVASVSADALVEKEILIELDRTKTAAAGLNIYRLAQELSGDNFTMASGTVRDGERKLLLRSVARYRSLEDLQNRLVGPTTRLADIATISYEQPDVNFRVRANSKPAIAAVVFKEGEANVRQVSDRVNAVVAKIQQNPRLRGMEMITLFSQGEVIDEALSTLLNSGMIGGLIAAVALFLFMRRFRLMLIIALGIPLSMLIGLTFMYFSDESLNLLTLLGLMLCVGLLVDNSVVVAENIHRLRSQGMDRREACIKGAGEVGLAITMSTLTTIVVFLPVGLVEGPGQFFMLRLAIPICVSVGASLLVALVFIPLSVYLTLSNDKKKAIPGIRERLYGKLTTGLRLFYEATFGRLNRAYNRLLTFFLTRRVELIILLLFAFWITGFFPDNLTPAWVPRKVVEFVDVQEEERSDFEIGVEMPDNATIEETEEWFLAAEQVIESRQEELDLAGWFQFHRKTTGVLQGWFNQPRTNDITAKEATEIVKEALPRKPGMELFIGQDAEMSDGEGKNIFTFTLNGDDIDLLQTTGKELESMLVRVDGVLGIKGSDDRATSELALVIDRQQAQRLGVNPEVVAGVVGYALRGTPLPKYRREDKEVPVRIRFREEDRESLTELADFYVPTEDGGSLPLSALTEAKVLPAPAYVFRQNKRVTRSIVLELEQGKEEETRQRLAMMQAAIDLPEGITFGANVQQQELDEDLAGLLFALALSIVFIYLLMGFLFESFVLPFSIVLTIPLSVIGVYWIHLITGFDIDFLGVVAMVVLVGVVVNNGIVLIDYVNRLRNQGMDRSEALLTATSRRFRPIMLTAITTIGGMVPLAFAGANSIGLSYTSFSLTLIGGMTTATLLTLLVVPVFYTLFDDAWDYLVLSLRRFLTPAKPFAGQRHGPAVAAGPVGEGIGAGRPA